MTDDNAFYVIGFVRVSDDIGPKDLKSAFNKKSDTENFSKEESSDKIFNYLRSFMYGSHQECMKSIRTQCTGDDSKGKYNFNIDKISFNNEGKPSHNIKTHIPLSNCKGKPLLVFIQDKNKNNEYKLGDLTCSNYDTHVSKGRCLDYGYHNKPNNPLYNDCKSKTSVKDEDDNFPKVLWFSFSPFIKEGFEGSGCPYRLILGMVIHKTSNYNYKYVPGTMISTSNSFSEVFDIKFSKKSVQEGIVNQPNIKLNIYNGSCPRHTSPCPKEELEASPNILRKEFGLFSIDVSNGLTPTDVYKTIKTENNVKDRIKKILKNHVRANNKGKIVYDFNSNGKLKVEPKLKKAKKADNKIHLTSDCDYNTCGIVSILTQNIGSCDKCINNNKLNNNHQTPCGISESKGTNCSCTNIAKGKQDFYFSTRSCMNVDITDSYSNSKIIWIYYSKYRGSDINTKGYKYMALFLTPIKSRDFEIKDLNSVIYKTSSTSHIFDIDLKLKHSDSNSVTSQVNIKSDKEKETQKIDNKPLLKTKK